MNILVLTPWFPNHPNDQHGNFVLDSIESLRALGHRFKMKMGGKEVSLPGKRVYPLGIVGWIVLKAGRWLGRI